jgi:ligand-binding sensor domain-containing protein
VAFDAPPNLIVYRDGNWENVLELVDETIAALLIGSQGDVWVGYSQGLLHYDGETWERIERETPFSAINALAEDQQGRIWVGGQNGLGVYDPRGE